MRKIFLLLLVAAMSMATIAVAEDTANREGIVKSRLKMQIAASKKLTVMADRLATAGTFQRMSQPDLHSLQKQLKTDMNKSDKVLEAAKDLREKYKLIDDQSVELEALQKQTAKVHVTVSKLLNDRAAGKKPA